MSDGAQKKPGLIPELIPRWPAPALPAFATSRSLEQVLAGLTGEELRFWVGPNEQQLARELDKLSAGK